MRKRWQGLLAELSDRPDVRQLEQFLTRLLEARGEEVEFVVLFGSMARGNWSRGSDYDVLLGLAGEDGKRLVDRIGELSQFAVGSIEVFPYVRSEWERMFGSFNLLLLDALEHGVVLFDRGAFARMRGVFRQWRQEGIVIPYRDGWRIQPGTHVAHGG